LSAAGADVSLIVLAVSPAGSSALSKNIEQQHQERAQSNPDGSDQIGPRP